MMPKSPTECTMLPPKDGNFFPIKVDSDFKGVAEDGDRVFHRYLLFNESGVV